MEAEAITSQQDSDPIAILRETGERLSDELREQILEIGKAAVGPLIEILDNDDLDCEEAPGKGWPPIHAVGLLAEIGAVEAIEPMLRVLAKTTWDDIIHDRIVLRLPELGSAVLEPALARIELGMDPDLHDSLCSVLANIGVRDERVYVELCRAFERDETMGAVRFGDYGDARALPLLARAMLEFEPNWESPFGLMGLADLVETYKMIAGVLPDELGAHVDGLYAERDRLAQVAVAPPGTGRKKIGRNDPCPCGSGTKYKKCCLAIT
jgi:hypothetical protein